MVMECKFGQMEVATLVTGKEEKLTAMESSHTAMETSTREISSITNQTEKAPTYDRMVASMMVNGLMTSSMASAGRQRKMALTTKASSSKVRNMDMESMFGLMAQSTTGIGSKTGRKDLAR